MEAQHKHLQDMEKMRLDFDREQRQFEREEKEKDRREKEEERKAAKEVQLAAQRVQEQQLAMMQQMQAQMFQFQSSIGPASTSRSTESAVGAAFCKAARKDSPAATHPPSVAHPSLNGENQIFDSLLSLMSEKFKALEDKLTKNTEKLESEVRKIDSKVQEICDDRKRQIVCASDIVNRNKSKPHDAVTTVAYDLVESLIDTAKNGNTQSLMNVLYNVLPRESITTLPSPPPMSEELQSALLNVMGYNVVNKHT